MSEVRRLSLGVIGHVDHGKTSLVRALTGMETDRLPEERRRGVSIALGFAHAHFGEAVVDFIDMPGHERFVRTMISGATGIEAGLLVVAANEGVKPQTLEHLQIAALLGVTRVLPVITKADLVPAARAGAVAEAVLEQARTCGLEPTAAQAVSALTGEGLDGLRAAIERLCETISPPPDDGFPWLPVDRTFSIAGRGTVVTGTLRRGRLDEADALVLSPGETELRIRGLQVHGAPASTARPGQRVAVNLRGLDPAQAPRGTALAPPGQLAPSTWLSVQVRSLADAPPLKTGVRLGLLFGSTEVEVRLRLLDRDVLEPGGLALAQLNTIEPVALPARERFVLRIPSPAATVGGGWVLDPGAHRLRRRDGKVLQGLGGLVGADPDRIISVTLEAVGPQGVSLSRLAALAGLSANRTAALLETQGACRVSGELRMARQAFATLAAEILATLQAHAETQPNGVAPRRLATLLPHASTVALDGVIAALITAGRLQVQGGSVKLPPRKAEAAVQAECEAALASTLAARLKAGGLTPPDVPELAPTAAAQRALAQLLKDGHGVRTFDQVQKRELVFHRDAVAEARTRLAPRLTPPGLTVGEAGAVLGQTRKFSVPLLEYLDMIRFTRRVGDRRVLGPAALG